ncbi:YlbF family regulator [Bacillaceae bacterium IKA-2]|nr:YlbF family regulator [Bacillaceae bacterium IKA-2]
MANPFDKARELGGEIKESNEFKQLEELHLKVNADPQAKEMLDNFRGIQMELQEKQMQGMELTEEEIQKAQSVFELVQQHEVIALLMESEQKMSQLIGDINKIIAEPLEALYGLGE